MRGFFYRLSPFTPDSAGAAAVFADLPALIITIDMNGTISTFRNRVGVQEESPVCVCSILSARELSYVLGRLEDFAEECRELMETFDHEFTVLLHGPISSLVGLDLDMLAADLEVEEGKPVMAVECTGNEPYEKGIAAAFDSVCMRLGTGAEEKIPGSYNLLGLNSVDHNDLALRHTIADSVDAAHEGECLSVWGCWDGWDNWRKARRAEENVLVSVSALSLAERMRREWGIPWVPMDELGLFAGILPEDERFAGLSVLLVGEQILGNTLRKVLEAAGCDVTVATFHTLIASLASDGDLAFEAESDFTEFAEQHEFDLVIGDSVLQGCLFEGQAFYELPHSAISRIADYEGFPPLGAEWFGGLFNVLEDSCRDRERA